MDTRVHIVSTMIRDGYDGGRIAMHHHLCGGSVAEIRNLRNVGPGSDYRHDSWVADTLNWPMVDLWARVPATLAYKSERIRHARAKRGESGTEYNQVGW